MTNIAIENGHRNSGFSHKKMVIFHSYVKLPEGIAPPPEKWWFEMFSVENGGIMVILWG